MTKAVQKITLSPSRDILFNKLVLSQSNVRRVKAGVSIEQLAESIAQRTLLQSLNVRAIVDAAGNETGMFEVPAGGRRYRALELLVRQKRMSFSVNGDHARLEQVWDNIGRSGSDEPYQIRRTLTENLPIIHPARYR